MASFRLPLFSGSLADAGSRFVVCVHDVSPEYTSELLQIFTVLAPLVGTRISTAVIPLPRGNAWDGWARAIELRATLRQYTSETLLHGLTHTRPPSWSLFSKSVGRADEFSLLSEGETRRRIHLGLQILRGELAMEVRGLVPPAWRMGKTRHIVGEDGLDFAVGMMGLHSVGGPPLRLATWSWDAGVVRSLGYVTERVGTALSLRKNAIPVVVIHPADVERGFLPRAVDRIRRLLAVGRSPVIFDALAELAHDARLREAACVSS